MEELFPVIPEDLGALSVEELQAFITESDEAIQEILVDPSSYVTADLSAPDLREATKAQIAALKAAKAELAARETVIETAEVELSEEDAAAFAELGETFAAEDPAPEPEPDPEPEPAAIVAAADVPAPAPAPAPAAPRRLPKPSPARRPAETAEERVALTASASFGEMEKGEAFPSMEEVARVMQARRRNFGMIPDGTSGEKLPIVRADWSHLYPTERKLTGDPFQNEAIIAAALDPNAMKMELVRRREGALTASGGLCAPVTPYYQLAMISVADRPVRAALPAFNADRGGIRYARPASLGDITTAVGVKTAAEDAAGGTEATKTCQVVDCPDFQETDVQIIFHCLQFGNLGARTFPERVTQWNNLTLAAHARLAETELLTGIDTASTQVTATDLGLGVSASLFSQIMAAGSGMRSRNRMDNDAVLRIMLPWWSVYEIVSDVFRGQFQRFDVDQARVVQLLRSINVEPTFYIDGAAGRNQVFGSQADGALLAFPAEIVWYLFPEGSFLFVDGGVLELGLVRDSVLNRTNDFQIFGESFENVAYIGVESLAVASTICDSGAVSNPVTVTECGDYGAS
jgi:hypothetical protein